jgi:GTP-binding protein
MALNLNKTELRISAGLPKQFPRDAMVQIAFSGRSNVGKSSLINSLLGRKSLARVSSSPGKTITINFYDVDKTLFLVDLPGYGFAKRSFNTKTDFSEVTDAYFTKNPMRDKIAMVLQLVDVRVGPTDDDKMMISYLKETGLPFLVVATKADKIKRSQLGKSMSIIRKTLDLTDEDIIIPVSALKREGQDRLLDVMEKIVKGE